MTGDNARNVNWDRKVRRDRHLIGTQVLKFEGCHSWVRKPASRDARTLTCGFSTFDPWGLFVLSYSRREPQLSSGLVSDLQVANTLRYSPTIDRYRNSGLACIGVARCYTQLETQFWEMQNQTSSPCDATKPTPVFYKP